MPYQKAEYCDLLSPTFDLNSFNFSKTIFKNYFTKSLPISSMTPLIKSNKKKIRPLSFNTKRLMSAIFQLDNVLFNHSVNLATHAYNFATIINLDNVFTNHLYNASLLHDIGKIFYKDILDLPRKLTKSERDTINEHVIASYIILTKNGYNKQIRLLALNHHLRTNGYPSTDYYELDSEISRVSKKNWDIFRK